MNSTTGPPPNPAPLNAELLWLIQTTELAKYSTAASTAWLVYDYITSFEDEVELIWRSQNKPPKFLYIVSRYLGLATMILLASNIFPEFCAGRFIFECVMCQTISTSVQLCLMIRVYALWGRSRIVAYALSIGFLLSEVGNFFMLYLGYRVIIPGLIPMPDYLPLSGCMVTAFPKFYNNCWLPTLAFELFLFTMNGISCLKYMPWDNTPTILRVLRDGSVYFFTVVLVLVMSTVGGYYPNTGFAEFFESWLPAVFSYSGAHFLLSIRRLAAERQARFDFSTVSTNISALKAPGNSETSETIELRQLSIASRRERASASGDVDVESGVTTEGTLALAHQRLSRLRPPDEENPESLQAPLDVDEGVSPAETLPPLALEPPVSRYRMIDRLTRWNLDWLKDWEM